MRIAYLVNRYPHVTHTFIRREIAALERRGVAVERISIRGDGRVLVDAADRAEAGRTRVVLDGLNGLNGLDGLGGIDGHGRSRGRDEPSGAAPGLPGGDGRRGGLGAVAPALLRHLAGRALAAPGALLAAARLALRAGRRSDRGVLPHLAYLAEAAALVRWLDARRVEHLHAHFGTNPAMVAMLCRVLGGPPYSFTAHGPEEFARAPGLALDEKLGRAAFAVAVCAAGERLLGARAAPADAARIHVVRCGVDPALLAAPPSPPPAARRLVFVGRLSPAKDPLCLVEAVAALARGGAACDLAVIGDGPLRAAVAARVAALGLRDRVALRGWVDEAGVRAEIRRARALVLPSRAEGLPVVLMEALALGRPAVATDVGGVAELVESGATGWLVPAGSVANLAAAMRAALDAAPEELARMGGEGAARVRCRHDPDVEAGRLAALFQASVEGARRRPDDGADARDGDPGRR